MEVDVIYGGKTGFALKSNGCQAYLLENALRANRKIEKYSTTLNFSLNELGICVLLLFKALSENVFSTDFQRE